MMSRPLYAAVGDGFSGATDSLTEAQEWVQSNRFAGAVYRRIDADVQPVESALMKTLTERIAEYAERKGITVLQAHETLLAFALDTLDGRRKGAQTINARPEHAKHLARARKSRAK